MANVLEMKNIYKNMVKTYRSDRVKRIIFAVQPGEFVAVMVLLVLVKYLLTIAAGLQAPTSGEVIVGGQSLNKLTKKQRLAQRFQKSALFYKALIWCHF